MPLFHKMLEGLSTTGDESFQSDIQTMDNSFNFCSATTGRGVEVVYIIGTGDIVVWIEWYKNAIV